MPGANLGTISANLLTQGAVENNGTMDLVWRASNSQTSVWAVDTSGNVATANLGAIGTGWAILHSGHYLSGTTTQMLTDYTPTGTMTLWWISSGVLTGINLGQHWPNISYVDTGPFIANGVDDILVKNNVDNHMYVWWINSANNTLTGVDLGGYWANISYVAGGNFLGDGSYDMLVKNTTNNGMYVWWVNPTTHALAGINLGNYWGNIAYVAGGNFLANGSYDMLVKNNVDNHMYVWWVNTSTDTLAGIDLGAHWAGIQYLASGHFAGTGSEMLVQNAGDSHVYLWWVNTANNTLTGVDLGAISTQWQVTAVADYNADGFADIVWHNSQTGQVQLWLMGGFSGPTNGATSAAAAAPIDVTSSVVKFAPLHELATIENGATLELLAGGNATVAFAGPTGTLILDHASSFDGDIVGLSGNGNATSSDVIDLKDIVFGSATKTFYAGTATGGTLTVTDGHNIASIALSGNYLNSTFSAASDGTGGTVVFDRPPTHFMSDGRFVFNGSHSNGDAGPAGVSHEGGAGSGSFNVDALHAGGWLQHIAQFSNLGMFESKPNDAAIPSAGPFSVTVGEPGSDHFIFRPGLGANTVASQTHSDAFTLGGHSPAINDALWLFSAERQASQVPPFFHTADSGHDAVAHSESHQSIPHADPLANLHLGNLMLHSLLIG
jgi:hypothetical protein